MGLEGISQGNIEWSLLVENLSAPRMFFDLINSQSLVNVAVEHGLNEFDAILAHDPGNAELMIENLVDTVKWILLVDKGVKQDAKSPDVLFFATV